MRAAYVDPSVCIAIAIGHHWAPQLSALLDSYERLLCSPTLEVELGCTLDDEEVRAVWAGLQRFDWVIPDRPLSREIARIRSRSRLSAHRTWHLACALYASLPRTRYAFASLHREQQLAAEGLGLRAVGPAWTRAVSG